jgi:hypothetical protein
VTRYAKRLYDRHIGEPVVFTEETLGLFGR